ncbi:MAG: Txe/YoeB family addiction module toxin [Bacteroidota bacterium]
MWTIEFSRKALKSAKKIRAANLERNLRELLEVLHRDPFEPTYEKLSGNLKGYYSRRINIKHRLVYSVDIVEKTVRVVSVWSHYE